MKTLLTIALLWAVPAHAVHLFNKETNIDITTNKVVHLEGEVSPESELLYFVQMQMTHSLPGPRIIIINSPGGRVDSGEHMISMLEEEKAEGIKQICVVMGAAHSMAFNLLTHCDVRLAVPDAVFVVHKIAISGISPFERGTAKNLRNIANDMEKEDEQFRRANAKAMGLKLKDYDHFADLETMWSAEILHTMHYLHGLVLAK